jgi:cobalt-precorrin 5A hydrolase
MKIALITINQPSLNSASRLLPYLHEYDVDLYSKNGLEYDLNGLNTFEKLDDILSFVWEDYDAIIFILAIGAVIRKIAPLLKSKESDPAVLVINLALDKIVPLLSGHLGGANALADKIALSLPKCESFISTATDQTDTLSFELLAQKRGWGIENLKCLAQISNRLINKKVVKVATYKSIFESIVEKENLKLVGFEDIDLNSVVISPIVKSDALTFRPKVYLGIGCNRDTEFEDIQEAVFLFLNKNSLLLKDIKTIASFEAKSDEKGLLRFAKEHNLSINFYKKDEINRLENEFSESASSKFFGLKGVAEPSAVLASEYKELIIKKDVYFKSITVAGAV